MSAAVAAVAAAAAAATATAAASTSSSPDGERPVYSIYSGFYGLAHTAAATASAVQSSSVALTNPTSAQNHMISALGASSSDASQTTAGICTPIASSLYHYPSLFRYHPYVTTKRKSTS